jgi:Tfp pilus assembly protein PilF
MPIDLPKSSEDQRIDSWKDIAGFFGRDERTVKRWEKERRLPVHRVPGGGRGTVYAFTEELTAWLRSSQQKESEEATTLTPGKIPASISDPHETRLPGPSPASARSLWLLGIGLALVVLILAGFPRFFQLRSVQGRALPTVSRRVESAPRKEAEDLYLQGRYHWNKRTPEGLTLALDEFTKSAKVDPNYALAYAGQADCYNLLREYTRMPASQAFPLAIAAANKSLELDDRLPEGHRALGFAYFYWNWDIVAGEREFRRALALNPQDVEAHHWYATALMSISRYPEAVAEIEEARRLDPMSNSIAADRAEVLASSGRQQESIQILLELEKSEPNFLSPYVYLANQYFDRKEYQKSFEQAEFAAHLSNDDKAIASIEASKKLLKQGGEEAMLEGLLAEQIQGFRQGNTEALAVAKTCALLGKNKEALEYLAKAYQRHEYGLITMIYWDGFQNLRPEPEFQDLLTRLGLPQSKKV